MRYLKLEQVYHTVCDEIVNDGESIKDLLEAICKQRMDASITIVPRVTADGDSPYVKYKKARITKVSDTGIDICSFRNNGSSINIRKINFSDVVEVRIVDQKAKLIQIKDKDTFSRFNLIDIED